MQERRQRPAVPLKLKKRPLRLRENLTRQKFAERFHEQGLLLARPVTCCIRQRAHKFNQRRIEERHANLDVGALLNARLAPDMKNFIYQVQSACDYVKAGAAWLSGQTPPKHADTEQTIDELRARVQKTVAFAESVKEAQYAGASKRKVSLSWAPGKVIGGEDYLLQMTIPNVFFHLSMAYAILRHNGVDVGKMDFLGSISFVEA